MLVNWLYVIGDNFRSLFYPRPLSVEQRRTKHGLNFILSRNVTWTPEYVKALRKIYTESQRNSAYTYNPENCDLEQEFTTFSADKLSLVNNEFTQSFSLLTNGNSKR